MGDKHSAYGSWAGAPRTMAVAVDAAVHAAQAGDAEAFGDAVVALRRVDREQLNVLLGDVTRGVLELVHPDGLDSDDAAQALQSCVRSAGGWYPTVDADLVLRALTGALGIPDPEDAPGVDDQALLAHGLVLIADLSGRSGVALASLLEMALRELMRAQTIEMP